LPPHHRDSHFRSRQDNDTHHRVLQWVARNSNVKQRCHQPSENTWGHFPTSLQ
jgi:hypothetical protein